MKILEWIGQHPVLVTVVVFIVAAAITNSITITGGCR